MVEMREAIKRMKLGKAAGYDGITPEMIKYTGEAGEEMLLNIIQLVWIRKQIPKDWEVAIIIPIYKKGDSRECENHRGISLLSVPGKIYSRILTQRITEFMEDQLEEAQCGFRKGRST